VVQLLREVVRREPVRRCAFGACENKQSQHCSKGSSAPAWSESSVIRELQTLIQ
jgi:hypothetical protein